MRYIEYLKKYDNFDKYILFMLSLDYTPAQIAEATGVTRQHVYNTLRRNRRMVKEWHESIAEEL